MAFALGNEAYFDVQGMNCEGIGIPVDIAVSFATQQEPAKGGGLGIEVSVEFLKAECKEYRMI